MINDILKLIQNYSIGGSIIKAQNGMSTRNVDLDTFNNIDTTNKGYQQISRRDAKNQFMQNMQNAGQDVTGKDFRQALHNSRKDFRNNPELTAKANRFAGRNTVVANSAQAWKDKTQSNIVNNWLNNNNGEEEINEDEVNISRDAWDYLGNSAVNKIHSYMQDVYSKPLWQTPAFDANLAHQLVVNRAQNYKYRKPRSFENDPEYQRRKALKEQPIVDPTQVNNTFDRSSVDESKLNYNQRTAWNNVLASGNQEAIERVGRNITSTPMESKWSDDDFLSFYRNPTKYRWLKKNFIYGQEGAKDASEFFTAYNDWAKRNGFTVNGGDLYNNYTNLYSKMGWKLNQ